MLSSSNSHNTSSAAHSNTPRKCHTLPHAEQSRSCREGRQCRIEEEPATQKLSST